MVDDGASSSSSSSFIYDVFLSFRGDTRHAFTDHLYHALTSKGINSFRDSSNLRVGDEIGPALVDAIEKSRMSIVVLSQEYASSSWCLDELVKIMEWSDKGRKRAVLPIFYKVEPSDVRNQKNEYEAAMMKHENGRNSQKVQAWRTALSAVANLSGEHCNNRSESDIIKKIVGEVLKKLPREPLHIPHPVEFDSRFEVVTSLLDIKSHNTLYMCIYGNGETYKTKFVGALYNKIIDEFEAACFLTNVSKKSKASINGLEDLQKTLLSLMDHEAKIEVGSTFRGCSEIKRKLEHKRVLLILDDVDCIEQLKSLAGGGDWFGPGSRIIITTRDENVAEHVLDGVENKKYCISISEFEGMEAAKSNKKPMMDAEEGDIVGFDDSLSIIINQLKKEDSLSNVVSITGMGGLGKTTLAQKIYKSNEVKMLFPCRAWSCVSKDYSERSVYMSLLCCLESSTSRYENSNLEILKEEVTKCLNKNKYLVVLDDVWEYEVWDKIKDAFPNNNNGSMILITSRNDEVAHYTRSRRPYHRLPTLNVEESWELFCKKVFGKEECPSYLEPIGKSIVERCGGLPLAIITLAGLVAKKERSYLEWSHIKGFIAWYLAEDPTKLMNVLKVSYDNLPEMLKPCFLYFAIYPEDYKIPARELIQLWIAEGFIQPEIIATSKVPRLEDVGDKYLNELVDRNLIQVVKRRSDGGVKTCQIHDLLRELCILESKVNNFLEVCTESTNNSFSNSCRLSLLCNEEYYMSLIKCSQSSTRSLFFFAGKKYPDDIMKNISFLHVLRVARQVSFSKDPCDLTKMIQLKYLKVEQGNCIRRDIPDWIWSLYNLETLDLRGWLTINKTINIWKLKRLRHVYVDLYAKLGVHKEGARHIYARLRAMLGVREETTNNKQMWNLQTLSAVDIEPQTILLLSSGCFPNLTKLGLANYSRPYYPFVNLHSLSNLHTLKIECCGKTISLDGIVFPPNISKITLRNFDELSSSCMSVLGRITSLRNLKLAYGWVPGTLSCGAAAGDFPQLEVFQIESLTNVSRLTIENGAMPHLQHMVIRQCNDLWKVPGRLLSLCDPSYTAS